jgi:hypothetical protein
MKIDSTEKFVLLGVKSHTRPPLEKFLGPESYRFSVWFRGALMSINRLQPTPQSGATASER